MGLMATCAAWRALSPEQKRLLKEKRIAGERTPDAWLRLLAGLAAYDRQADALRSRAAVLMIVLPLLTFFGVLLGRRALDPEGPAILWAAGFALALAAPPVGVFLVTRKADLANQLREVAIPLLALLRDDLARDSTVALGLDLRGGTARPKLREERPAMKQGNRSIHERVFVDPWMTGDAALHDGTRLRWRLTDEIRERCVTRRNAGGKTKTKTKYRVSSLAEVALDLPTARYRLRPGATPPGVRAQTLEKRIKLRGRRGSRLKGAEPRSAPLAEALRSIATLYALAEPIRKQEPNHA